MQTSCSCPCSLHTLQGTAPVAHLGQCCSSAHLCDLSPLLHSASKRDWVQLCTQGMLAAAPTDCIQSATNSEKRQSEHISVLMLQYCGLSRLRHSASKQDLIQVCTLGMLAAAPADCKHRNSRSYSSAGAPKEVS